MRLLVILLLLLVPSLPVLAKKRVKLEERAMPVQTAESSLKALASSLDPYSVSQHLAFYELYPETAEGKASLQRAWQLLSGGITPKEETKSPLPVVDIQAIISLVTRQSFDPPAQLNEEQLNLITKISERLGNRKLKGYRAWTKKRSSSLLPRRSILPADFFCSNLTRRLIPRRKFGNMRRAST